ncbi:MAG: glycoside hydrolase family 16 protein [Saprospiraceae bacterium]|nr:glycoside hydrolase family 16 protein [Saprospiraceae bacterium]
MKFISQRFQTLIVIILTLPFFCDCKKDHNSSISSPESNNNLSLEDSIGVFPPEGYSLSWKDEFVIFDPSNWSKGLVHDDDPSIRMIWNMQTGGEHLLNDKYAGYLLDENAYVENGLLYLVNKEETIEGIDPLGEFAYTTGWIQSLQKVNFNGTQRPIYLEIKAKFPRGEKVWPAIWLIDDSPNRMWPPEIDIWEYFGVFFNPDWGLDRMYMRYIYGHWSDPEDHSLWIEPFQQDYTSSYKWHIFGFKWNSSAMIWYIDGEEVHRKTRGLEVPNSDWPNVPMALVVNNGLMSSVEKGNTPFPNELILDYMLLYEKD